MQKQQPNKITLNESKQFYSSLHNVGRGMFCKIPESEEEAFCAAEDNTVTNTRSIECSFLLSSDIIWWALNENEKYPYHLQSVKV